MALLSLLIALALMRVQQSFGQQINEGNNLVAVASHKLAAMKQQSQKQNVTDAAQESESERNINSKEEKELEESYTNNSVIYPSGGTIASIKFVRNPAYDGPMPSFSIINSKNAADPSTATASHESASFNVLGASTIDIQSNIATNQMTTKQTEEKSASISKSPIFISFAPRSSDAAPPQSPYFISALPTQSSLPNMVSLQPSPSAPLKQQAHQTFSTVQYQPSNVQSPANMRLRFVPAPIQNTVPIQNSIPIQNTVPIQNSIPIQNTVPIQNSIPIQNTVPTQNTVPIQNTIPMQSSIPMQNAVPIHNSIPMHNTAPIQNTLSFQKTVDTCNTIQNPQVSFLLSHLLSQSPIKQDATPTVIRYQNQDQKPSKKNAVQSLLPLILQLLTEKNNNCCEFKNERPRTYSRYKQGRKTAYDKFCPNSLELAMLSDVADHFHRLNQNKRIKKPYDDALDDEDYNDESSDYTAEDYDDED